MPTTNPGDCRPDGVIAVRRYDVEIPARVPSPAQVDRSLYLDAYNEAFRKAAAAPKVEEKVDAPLSVQSVADGLFAKAWARQKVNTLDESEVDLSADLFRSSFSATNHERSFK